MHQEPTRTVVIEREFRHRPEKLWRALTQPHLIADWLMQNDFVATPGHAFSLHNQPTPDLSIDIACTVIAVEPPHRLSYSWSAFGLDSVVTFTLTPAGDGTLLRLEQAGFRPDQDAAYKGARAAWPGYLRSLSRLLDNPEEIAMATPSKTPRKSAAGQTFSAEELEAMQAAKKEAKAQKKPGFDGKADLLAAIAAMEEPDRTLATKLHALVTATAPTLSPKTWYGMPAWANAAGKAVCFFQSAAKFKSRYSTLGFQDPAKLDEGGMWPTAFALTRLGPAEEKQIAALLRKALG